MHLPTYSATTFGFMLSLKRFEMIWVAVVVMLLSFFKKSVCTLT